MNRPYRKLISNGVFATPKGEPSDYLQVFSADNGMNIIVSAGCALIGDKWFENPSDFMITISQNTEVLTRIDSIIAQVDKTQAGRVGNIVYRKGNGFLPHFTVVGCSFPFLLIEYHTDISYHFLHSH